MMASERNIDDEEEQFTQAFGEHLTNISQESRSEIQMIKNNHPNVTMFTLSSYLADCLSELAWELMVATSQIMNIWKHLISKVST